MGFFVCWRRQVLSWLLQPALHRFTLVIILTAKMLGAIESEFAERSPSCLLAQGEGGRTTIAPLIAERYKLVEAENGFELYQRR